MYCKKLYNILLDDDHKDYNITELDIDKLDQFIRNKTTSRERLNLDPAKLSMEMELDYHKSIKLFILGCKQELFKMKMVIDCELCNNRHSINSINEDLLCEEFHQTIDINKNKDSIYVYFKLLEKPQICKKISQNDVYMIDDIMGKSRPSNTNLSDILNSGVKKRTLEDMFGDRIKWN
ncbi:Uncharacterised protein [[Clostridium] sordellii]|uniref:hypothetical protein n=1 Tax=Paraclostridium sordellii TaxID=1505 RepID=UPI0005DC16C8|nr:hypothetical protein [Paeniclostridium sordellii]CEQ08960.1 Uncharacterised protein [[Clostridium] sordellii] [Paeniclostridium sordellii]